MPAVPKAKTPGRVVVVGAGPAGLMAAATAAERGHEVILLERSDRHGGQISLAAVPPHKEDLRLISDYLYGKAQRAGVTFRFSCEATPESVRNLSPDAVIVATGSLPVVPRFCASAAGAVTAQDILSGAEAGKNVLMLGGGLIGCETAEYLAAQGRSVTVVEMLPQLAKDMEWCARVLLLRRMASLGIKLRSGNEILSIGAGNAVTVRNEKGRRKPSPASTPSSSPWAAAPTTPCPTDSPPRWTAPASPLATAARRRKSWTPSTAALKRRSRCNPSS